MKTKVSVMKKTSTTKATKRKKKEIIFRLPNIHIGGGRK